MSKAKFRFHDGEIKEGEVIDDQCFGNYLRVKTPDGHEYNVHGSALVFEENDNESTESNDKCPI